jgi:hypothetical protein
MLFREVFQNLCCSCRDQLRDSLRRNLRRELLRPAPRYTAATSYFWVGLISGDSNFFWQGDNVDSHRALTVFARLYIEFDGLTGQESAPAIRQNCPLVDEIFRLIGIRYHKAPAFCVMRKFYSAFLRCCDWFLFLGFGLRGDPRVIPLRQAFRSRYGFEMLGQSESHLASGGSLVGARNLLKFLLHVRSQTNREHNHKITSAWWDLLRNRPRQSTGGQYRPGAARYPLHKGAFLISWKGCLKATDSKCFPADHLGF